VTGRSAVYLDSSAIVKLVAEEAESNALLRYLAERPARFTSQIARIEVPRALARAHGADAARAAVPVLDRIVTVALDDQIVSIAAQLAPSGLRTLDAVHLASAMAVGEELDVVVAYDHRLGDAARRAGLAVASPR